jgi:hypothetical protein
VLVGILKGNPIVYLKNVTVYNHLSDRLKVGAQNIVEMAVAGANWNLKLSEYYVLGSHRQI